MELVARDEAPHPPGDEPGWGEAWWFEFGGPIRCHVQLMTGPAGRRYWAAVVVGGDLIAVIDNDVPAGGLELRTHGLWADHIIEDPFDHVSVGCEAFALRLDPPLDVTADAVGDLVAFGLDLGWETTGAVELRPGGYEIPCEVHGEVLLADDRLEITAAPGRRGHAWGVHPWDRWLTSSAPDAPGRV